MRKFLNTEDAPITDPVVDPGRGNRLSWPWEEWFHRLPATLNAIPSINNLVELHEQTAAITATDMSNGAILAGHFRITYEHHIETAASASSATRLTITWTDEGVTQTVQGVNLVGNTQTTRTSAVQLIHADAGTAINYAATYTSVGATAMEFELSLLLEEIRPPI